jgi:hypothetical protein
MSTVESTTSDVVPPTSQKAEVVAAAPDAVVATKASQENSAPSAPSELGKRKADEKADAPREEDPLPPQDDLGRTFMRFAASVPSESTKKAQEFVDTIHKHYKTIMSQQQQRWLTDTEAKLNSQKSEYAKLKEEFDNNNKKLLEMEKEKKKGEDDMTVQMCESLISVLKSFQVLPLDAQKQLESSKDVITSSDKVIDFVRQYSPYVQKAASVVSDTMGSPASLYNAPASSSVLGETLVKGLKESTSAPDNIEDLVSAKKSVAASSSSLSMASPSQAAKKQRVDPSMSSSSSYVQKYLNTNGIQMEFDI